MTYLVLRYTSLGNVAMTVPVIASVSARYPEHEFVVVTEKRLEDMFYGLKNVHRISVLSTMPKIDAVIDLQADMRTLGTRVRYKLKGVPVYRYHNTKGISEHQRYAEVFRRAGLESGDEFDALAVNEASKVRTEELFGAKSGLRIGIAPFAKSRSNILPYRVTKEIIAHYADCPHTQVYLFGAGVLECEMLRQWAGIYPNTISVAGQLRLSEELELMRTLDVMICLDSANQHLSSLVGLRAVSIWCATHRKNGFYGWKQRPEDCVEIENLRCRPCTRHGRKHCKFRNFACQEITAKQVIKMVNDKW